MTSCLTNQIWSMAPNNKNPEVPSVLVDGKNLWDNSVLQEIQQGGHQSRLVYPIISTRFYTHARWLCAWNFWTIQPVCQKSQPHPPTTWSNVHFCLEGVVITVRLEAAKKHSCVHPGLFHTKKKHPSLGEDPTHKTCFGRKESMTSSIRLVHDSREVNNLGRG